MRREAQIPMHREVEPRPYAARSLAQLDPAPAAEPDPAAAAGPVVPAVPAVPVAEPQAEPPRADDRPRLPRREPQQNLVTQLEDEPEDDAAREVAPGEGTARTLAAFHKGTRRARDGADDA
jgi:hypothetical protein